MLEQALRQSLADALQAQVAGWGDRGSRDVLRALARELSQGEAGRGQRLGAAVIRAGLTRALAQGLAAPPECRGNARLDAAYEGLALSVLGQLEFTEASGTVIAACVPVAEQTQRLASGAVVTELVGPVARDLARVAQSLGEARARCPAAAPGLSASLASLLDELGRAPARPSLALSLRLLQQIGREQASLSASAETLGAPCTAALKAAGGVAHTGTHKLSLSGLDAVPLGDLIEAQEMATKAGEAAAAAREAQVLIGALTRGSLSREDLVRLARQIAPEQAAAVEGEAAAVRAEGSAIGEVALRSLAAAVVDGDGGAAIDPALIVEALDRRFELRGGKLSPRALLGLGDSPWMVELNGGLPRLDSGQRHVEGDARLGYEGASFGAVVQGGLRYFDLATDGVSTDNLNAYGSFNAWWRPGERRDKARFELRLTGGIQYLDTTTTATATKTRAFSFGDFDSLLIQGGFQLGIQLRPGERFALALRAGAGLQYETHDTTSVDARGVSLDSPDTTSIQASGQLRLRWRVVPAALSLRLEGDGAYFQVSRDDFSFSSDGGAQLGATLTKQFFLQGRLFVDLDLLSLGGFLPAAFVAIERTSVSGPQVTESSTVPVLGVGIVHPTF
jgi:hypothetical protein